MVERGFFLPLHYKNNSGFGMGILVKPSFGLLFLSALLVNGASQAAPPEENAAAISKIIYGSCIHQNDPQPIWKAINAESPDLMVFLGDNIYGDTNDMKVLEAKYQKLGSNEGFKQLKANTPVVATWDDHDYGKNDAGKDYPHKEASRQIMLDFFEEPADSPRRTRDSGIYTSYYFGEGNQRVQLILSDLRWNRTEPEAQNIFQYLWSLVNSKGPYEPTTGEGATILGEAQWAWLESELQKPAAIRIFASSLQIIPESSGWEAWAVFPNERDRLFSLLSKSEQNALFMISGDTHWSEFSQLDYKGFQLLELTASGLSEEWDLVSPNEHRVGGYYNKANFGMIEIDWEASQINLGVYDVNGSQKLSKSLSF